MDTLAGTARRALAHVGLPAGRNTKDNSSANRDDNAQAGDSERLLSSPSPSGDSEVTIAAGGNGREKGSQEEEEEEVEVCDCCVGHDKIGSRRQRLRDTWVRRLTSSRINLFASLFWFLGSLVLLLLFGGANRKTPANGNFGWSPVIDAGAVEYVEYTFPYFDIDAGQDLLNNIPSYEQDVRWYELYNWLARVPKEDAANMPNGTVTIPGDEEHSLVWLGVFHELHCLNVLRKLVWFEYYDVHADLVAGRNNMRNHLVHCIDAIRKGIMCHADITPVPFWSTPDIKNGEITPMFKIQHTCRNFDKILDWAKNHPVEHVECPDEEACGALAAITMTVPPGDPQPTHWPDRNPAGADVYSEEDEKVLNCEKSVLDWC